MPSEHRTTVYFTMVDWPVGFPKRVGSPHGSKASAESWLHFVSTAYNGADSWVEDCPLRFVDGELDAASVRLLDERFNMDPPEVADAE